MKTHTKQPVKAKQIGRRFWVEIPPVEWIFKYENYQVGRHKDGSLYVVDHYDDNVGVGWVIQRHKNFSAVLNDGMGYTTPFLRALAHKLGIEKFRWTNGNPKLGPVGKTIWIPTDDYLEGGDEPETKEQCKARLVRRSLQLAAPGWAPPLLPLQRSQRVRA